jgi:hypothetical protein
VNLATRLFVVYNARMALNCGRREAKVDTEAAEAAAAAMTVPIGATP